MILCEREIQALVKRKLVVIEGCPNADSKRWSSTALDLTLHGVILEWDVTSAAPTGGAADEVRPFSDTFNVQQMMDDERYAKKVTIPDGDGYPLRPGGFILGFTVEKVSIPHDRRIAARVEGKSNLRTPTAQQTQRSGQIAGSASGGRPPTETGGSTR